MNKDYFSNHAKIYAAFRPVYPQDLYDFVLQQVRHKGHAWDCGTGNGQVAKVLSRHFNKVSATDISQQQLAEAEKAINIEYTVSSAESTPFPDTQFDLITAAQALHWFNVEKFYGEVRRTATNDAVVALWGYGMLDIEPGIDRWFNKFYHEIVGPYWDEARKHVEQNYATIPFPFEEIPQPHSFAIVTHWTAEHFAGYLTSWSATQKFIKSKGFDPVPDLMAEIKALWKPDEVKKVTFPVFLKIGRVNK